MIDGRSGRVALHGEILTSTHLACTTLSMNILLKSGVSDSSEILVVNVLPVSSCAESFGEKVFVVGDDVEAGAECSWAVALGDRSRHSFVLF
jgi:hypothetical protein